MLNNINDHNRLFQRLVIRDWRQFSVIDIEFHPRLTVLTGANGAGKSTLLNVLSQHFGWKRPYLSTPSLQRNKGVLEYLIHKLRKRPRVPLTAIPGFDSIGYLQYVGSVNPAFLGVAISAQSNAAYSINIANQQTVTGMLIPSHRHLPVYQPVSNIPTTSINASQASKSFYAEMLGRTNGSLVGHSATYRIKESLISMATFGAGNNYVKGDESVLNTYLGFEKVLHKILPASLGFKRISIRTPEVVIETTTGDFIIDAASGGIMAIIEIAWQIHVFALALAGISSNSKFVVTIDEPENHLHPSMQRSLMSNLIEAFPNVQFIIATHSPFMVSSVKDSHVYVLGYEPDVSDEVDNESSIGSPKFNGEHRVRSMKLEAVNRAGSANEVLREVLGLPATIPHWVENELKEVVSKYRGRKIDAEAFVELREDLEKLGVTDLFPEVVTELFGKLND